VWGHRSFHCAKDLLFFIGLVEVESVAWQNAANTSQILELQDAKCFERRGRGWTLDVLNVVRSLKKNEFVLSEVYDHADQLAELHPHNHHINDKLRQQLQVLRDMNLLEFLGNGSYRLP
jgi:hypothetical protein